MDNKFAERNEKKSVLDTIQLLFKGRNKYIVLSLILIGVPLSFAVLKIVGVGGTEPENSRAFAEMRDVFNKNAAAGQDRIQAGTKPAGGPSSSRNTGTVVYPDGTEITKFANGTVATRTPDGKIKALLPDGTIKTKMPDGTIVTRWTVGGTSKRLPDGTVQTVFPDGTRSTRLPNGNVVMETPDGKETVQSFDGKVLSVRPIRKMK